MVRRKLRALLLFFLWVLLIFLMLIGLSGVAILEINKHEKCDIVCQWLFLYSVFCLFITMTLPSLSFSRPYNGNIPYWLLVFILPGFYVHSQQIAKISGHFTYFSFVIYVSLIAIFINAMTQLLQFLLLQEEEQQVDSEEQEQRNRQYQLQLQRTLSYIEESI